MNLATAYTPEQLGEVARQLGCTPQEARGALAQVERAIKKRDDDGRPWFAMAQAEGQANQFAAVLAIYSDGETNVTVTPWMVRL